MAEERQDNKIARGDAKNKCIDFSDALQVIGKISVGLTDYGVEPSKYCRFNLDPDEALVLAHDALNDMFPTDPKTGRRQFGPLYKGSERDGAVQSRILEVEFDDGAKGKNVGYHIRIANGPGIKSSTGAVMPDKTRTDQLAKTEIFLTRDAFRKMMAAVQARVLAHEVVDVVRQFAKNQSGTS